MQKLEIVKEAQNAIYKKCGFKISKFFPEKEHIQYYAHNCVLEDKNILFRIAKKTPTKTGWFVTIYKRDKNNIIIPYDQFDKIDFVVIAILDNNYIGEFIFPKSLLLKKKIFSTKENEGKRAIRFIRHGIRFQIVKL